MEFVATQPNAESCVAHRRYRSFRSSFMRLWEAWPAVCAHHAVRPLVRALAVSVAFTFLLIAVLSFAPDDDTKTVDKPVRVVRSRVVARQSSLCAPELNPASMFHSTRMFRWIRPL